jgi:hypothetical protein
MTLGKDLRREEREEKQKVRKVSEKGASQIVERKE